MKNFDKKAEEKKTQEKNNQPLVTDKDPKGAEGALSQEADAQESVGKGGTPGGTKSVKKTPDPIQEVPAGEAKRADNLGAGEKNLTNNSTLNVVPAEVPDVNAKGPKCKDCDGSGLQDEKNPNTALCPKCQGTGKE